MNTECKDCKLRKGDCGHHFLFNGVVNYDIPSQTVCDKYDNCMFFKRDEEKTSEGDLISREALKKAFDDYIKSNPNVSGIFEVGKFIIDNAPTVELFCHYEYNGEVKEPCVKGPCPHEKPQGEWYDHIPDKCLKARHGAYVLYDVDYLLKHLATEIYLLECSGSMRKQSEGLEDD